MCIHFMKSGVLLKGSALSIAIASLCLIGLQAGQAAAEDVAIACAQAVQAAVAGCDLSQEAHICQVACSQLDQTIRQMPHTSVSSAASNRPGSPDASTGPQQAGSSRQLTPLHASKQCESTAAPDNAMLTPHTTGTAHTAHSAEEMPRLLAQSAVVSAAAIAALRPNASPHDRAKPLLESLVNLAMQLPEGSSREACMVAAAAVVNKWPAGGFSSVCNSTSQQHTPKHAQQCLQQYNARIRNRINKREAVCNTLHVTARLCAQQSSGCKNTHACILFVAICMSACRRTCHHMWHLISKSACCRMQLHCPHQSPVSSFVYHNMLLLVPVQSLLCQCSDAAVLQIV